MAKKKMVFDITPEGFTLETEGYTGKMCLTELETFKTFMAKEYGVKVDVKNIKMKNAALAITQPEKTKRSV
jgi:hypothetical protein